jgi:2-polyprenyl-6-methoxyphenol hydroxylase-like FAD-dependent oxidoreductase
MDDSGDRVNVRFEGGGTASYSLVFGADGVHSRVRELMFGPEGRFDRFLGYYVAGFRAPERYNLRRSLLVHEEPGRVAFLYPLEGKTIDVVLVFAHPDVGFVPHNDRLQFTRQQFKGAGWILNSLLDEAAALPGIFFDPLTQIVMPHWSKGRVSLLGDACGCLTLIAGQGSHMAMAGAYIVSRELERNGSDHQAAFGGYENYLKPIIDAKQKEVVRFGKDFVPPQGLMPWVRQLMVRTLFTRILIRYAVANSKSVLEDYSG